MVGLYSARYVLQKRPRLEQASKQTHYSSILSILSILSIHLYLSHTHTHINLRLQTPYRKREKPAAPEKKLKTKTRIPDSGSGSREYQPDLLPPLHPYFIPFHSIPLNTRHIYIPSLQTIISFPVLVGSSIQKSLRKREKEPHVLHKTRRDETKRVSRCAETHRND